MSTREPAGLMWVQTQSWYTAHDVLRDDVGVVLFFAHRFHDLLKDVVGDAGVNIIADDFSSGQSPLLICILCHTPTVQSLRDWHGGGTSRWLWVALGTLLPVPAPGESNGDLLLGDKVVTVVFQVAFG